MIKAKVRDQSLVVRVFEENWTELQPEVRSQALQKIETYMRSEELRQTKIVGNDGRLLAAVSRYREGTIFKYVRRDYR